MKRLIITTLFTFFGLVVFSRIGFAATAPTPTATVSQSEEQINNLKDRIASRVAQLNLVEKRGIIGTVSDVSETQLTITDLKGNVRIIDVDELTKFSSPSAKSSFGISDITKGTTIGTIGLYNKDSKRLLARWIDVMTLPKVFSGGIVTLDTENYTFTIATADNQTVSIDVESITRTNSFTKTGGLVKSGFSKLTVGQRVMIVGFPSSKDPNLFVASRILLFPDLPVNPQITLINPTDIAPVATGSGKKLQPLTK